jgi:benzoylformate decarboxylase
MELVCLGKRVTDVAELDSALSEALTAKGPTLVNIAADETTTDLFASGSRK